MSELFVDGSKPQLDYHSPDWHRIAEFLSEEYSELVKEVLSHDVSERRADFCRGRIHQIRMILDWAPQASR